jgi:hypothetical protein
MNSEQNRINSKYTGTTNRTGSRTDMPERQTKPDQQPTWRNNQDNEMNNGCGCSVEWFNQSARSLLRGSREKSIIKEKAI